MSSAILIKHALEQSPLKFKELFTDEVHKKIASAIDERRKEIASTLFSEKSELAESIGKLASEKSDAVHTPLEDVHAEVTKHGWEHLDTIEHDDGKRTHFYNHPDSHDTLEVHENGGGKVRHMTTYDHGNHVVHHSVRDGKGGLKSMIVNHRPVY